jgi:hypothetical protein
VFESKDGVRFRHLAHRGKELIHQASSHRAGRTWRFGQRAPRDRVWALAPPHWQAEQFHVAGQPREVARRDASKVVGLDWQQTHIKATNDSERVVRLGSNARHREAAKPSRKTKHKG